MPRNRQGDADYPLRAALSNPQAYPAIHHITIGCFRNLAKLHGDISFIAAGSQFHDEFCGEEPLTTQRLLVLLRTFAAESEELLREAVAEQLDTLAEQYPKSHSMSTGMNQSTVTEGPRTRPADELGYPDPVCGWTLVSARQRPRELEHKLHELADLRMHHPQLAD
jgi:hypothetical protein